MMATKLKRDDPRFKRLLQKWGGMGGAAGGKKATLSPAKKAALERSICKANLARCPNNLYWRQRAKKAGVI
jgi:hypothetical protein